MPARWVICPVDTVTAGGVTSRRPRVGALLDPGRPGKEYRYSAVISDGLPGQINNWCLVFVRGADLTAVDADSECQPVLEQDYEDNDGVMDKTIGELAWSGAKITRIRNRLEAVGVDTSGYTAATPVATIVRDLGRRIRAAFPGPAGTWTS